MTRAIFMLTAVGLLAGLAVWAAPGKPTEKEKPLAPPTREQHTKAENNFKLMGLAAHNYLSAHNTWPTDIVDKDGKPILSWRVAVLPYVEGSEELYKEFKLDEPWDSDANKKLLEKIPSIYIPLRGRAAKGQTFIQSFNGEGAFIQTGKNLGIANITDGTSNTLMFVEGEKAIEWTRPGDVAFDGKKAPKVGGEFDGHFHATFGDGHVHFFGKSLKAETLVQLITIAGGEVINGDFPEPDLFKD